MTEEQKTTPFPTAESVEQLFTRAGKRLGRVAGKTTLRIQKAMGQVRVEANQMDVLATVPEHETQGERDTRPTRPAMERAEELVGQLVHRVSFWTKSNGLQVRRSVARMREEAEDMWVEAQQMRNTWKEPHK